MTPNNAPDAQEQELAFTSSRPIKIETDAIAIKDEPESDEEEEQEQDENEETEPANSAAELHSEGADYNPSEMNAFRSPRPDSEEEDLYTSSVSPRYIRGPSISSDTLAMHGGLGERSASPPRPSVQFAESIDSSAPGPSIGQGQTSTKRKAPHVKDAADHDVEDAELALLEIQAKRRLNAARRVRDSLVPFGEEQRLVFSRYLPTSCIPSRILPSAATHGRRGTTGSRCVHAYHFTLQTEDRS